LGGIEKYLETDSTDKNNTERQFNIVPRDDQKPVLNFDKGSMAISAVPGAGKTTILLALIIKLMDSGINPENIFVSWCRMPLL
jgi:superfamily II DNA or RNA helicase